MKVNIQPVLMNENTIVSREKIVKPLSKDSRVMPLKILGSSIYKKVAYKNSIFPAKIFLLVPFIFFFIFTGTAQAIDVSSCGTLGTDGGYYNLTQDVSTNTGTCITFSANNSIFNGNGHNIRTTDAAYNAGIMITGSNNNLSNFSTNDNIYSAYGFEIIDSSNNSVSHFISNYNYNDGFFIMRSSNNTLSDFSVSHNSYGFGAAYSQNNKLSNFTANYNDVGFYPSDDFQNNTLSNFSADYNANSGIEVDPIANINLLINADVSYNGYSHYTADGHNFYGAGDVTYYGTSDGMIFRNMNLSGIYRRIYLQTTAQIFEVENNGIDWQTNISGELQSFDRQIFSWTQDNLTWNDDNATGGIIAYYSFSNLYPLRNYTVSDNGTLLYTLTTDSSGNIPQFSIALSGGTDQISVIATPPSGNDTTPPTISIIAPSNGSTVSGIINVTVSASDNVGVTKVELYRNGTLVGTTTSSPFTFIWNTTQIADGIYTLQSKAYDAANNTGVSPLVTITVSNVPNQLVTITVSPSSDTLLLGQNQQFTATGKDAHGNLINITPAWSSNTGTISSSGLFTAQSVGTGIITATVVSLNGTATVAVINDNSPVVSITSPLNNSIVGRRSNVIITANTSDKIGVASVEFYVNGALQCIDNATQSYTCNWKVPGKPGATYSLIAKAIDAANSVLGQSAMVYVTSK
jgi:parallel beta-helix repeat protein